APSVRAASSVSRGIADSPAAITTSAKPAHTQVYAMMIDGVIRLGPSQEIPPKGLAKVAAPIDAFHGPLPDGLSIFHVPSSAVLTELTFLPVESFSSTVTPGRPFSPGSTLPGVPPPGLKSRHTVPVMPLLEGLAATACLAPVGTSSGGIAVRP